MWTGRLRPRRDERGGQMVRKEKGYRAQEKDLSETEERAM